MAKERKTKSGRNVKRPKKIQTTESDTPVKRPKTNRTLTKEEMRNFFNERCEVEKNRNPDESDENDVSSSEVEDSYDSEESVDERPKNIAEQKTSSLPGQSYSAEVTSSTSYEIHALKKYLSTTFGEITNSLTKLQSGMDDIQKNFNDLSKTSGDKENIKPTLVLSETFPIKTLEEFDLFEQDKEKQQEMYNFAISWGGTNSRTTARQNLYLTLDKYLIYKEFQWIKIVDGSSKKKRGEENEENGNETDENDEFNAENNDTVENENRSEKTIEKKKQRLLLNTQYSLTLYRAMKRIFDKKEKEYKGEDFGKDMADAIKCSKQKVRDEEQRRLSKVQKSKAKKYAFLNSNA